MEKKKRNKIFIVILFIVSLVIISTGRSTSNDITSRSPAYQSGWRVGTCVRNALKVMVSYRSN
jgi:hypothetical protein